jgi:uncharacterized membrane-anchored protein YitT (DUF2179 family)
MKKEKHPAIKLVYQYTLLFVGAVIAAIGLEIFLIPNNIIDGGIVGISIMTSYLTNIPLGIFTFVLNVPFLIVGYKQIGKTFLLSSLFAIVIFSIFVSILHPIAGLTKDVLLATVFGGVVLGAGVGLILRNSGSLDGTEIVAIILNKKTMFSVGQIVMILNVFIFAVAALVLGWDRALYSMLAYFIAHKAIDMVMEGFDEAKGVMIISDNAEEIAEAILARLGRGVTFMEGTGGFSKDKKTILYSVVTRLEISKLKSIVRDKDEKAFVTVSDVSDVMGGEHKKKAIH